MHSRTLQNRTVGSHARTGLVLVATVAGALALAGCTSGNGTTDDAAPTEPTVVDTQPADTPSPDPTEATTAPPSATAVIPTDCAQIEQLPSLAGKLPARQEGADPSQFKHVAGEAAEYQFGCNWFEGDTTGGFVMFHRVPGGAAAKTVDGLREDGFDCKQTDVALICSKQTQNTQYPVTDYATHYVRGDEWISIRSSNVDIPAGLDDIVKLVWPS